MVHEISIKKLWSVKLEHNFNAVACGKLFNSPENVIAVGGQDGVVKVYKTPQIDGFDKPVHHTLKLKTTLEAKCGSILHLLMYDIARLSSCDLVVADNRGSIVLFFEGQILDRSSQTASSNSGVTALTVQKNKLNDVKVICGKEKGEIICFNTFSQLWNLRLDNFDHQRIRNRTSITHLLATSIKLSTCSMSIDYLLASDSNGRLHAIQDGRVRKTINVGCVVNMMCAGNFLSYDEPDSKEMPTQIALGCSDGFVLLLIDMEINREFYYTDVGHPITHLRKIPNQDDSAESSNVDYLVCCGHFSSVKVFLQGKEKASMPLPAWPVTVHSLSESTAKPTRFDLRRFLVGCTDQSLHMAEVL